MNEIYWITRLDGLETLFEVVCFLSIVLILFLGYMWIECVEDEKDQKTWNKWLKGALFAMITSILCLIFVPNSKQAVMIWGVGGTIDYVKSNNTAKQLPDKCIKALDKFVDEYMLNENKED